MNPYPIKISRPEPHLLQIDWSDGASGVIKLSLFRDQCPCAGCKEDRKKAAPEPKFNLKSLNIMKPGKYELKELKQVGNYAIAAVWGDGHDVGIYPYEYLRELTVGEKLESV